MKRFLLAGAAFAALTSSSFAADMPDIYAPVDVWSGFFVGLQAGYGLKDVDVTEVTAPAVTTAIEADDFVGGLYYGRNWQSGNWVYGLDSSISYMGLDEVAIGPGVVDVEANFLGLSRLKLGYAMDNVLLFVAGGLATTIVDVSEAGASDDDWAFGWTIGAGIETKLADNWSARLEYIYFDIESDVTLPAAGPVDVDIDGHIVRAGVAYHF